MSSDLRGSLGLRDGVEGGEEDLGRVVEEVWEEGGGGGGLADGVAEPGGWGVEGWSSSESSSQPMVSVGDMVAPGWGFSQLKPGMRVGMVERVYL